MLRNLTIENFALIDKSSIDFEKGFTVITGETGAGKSIMLDALSLIMGARADSKVISDKTRKTIIEGIFTTEDDTVRDLFEDNYLEWEDGEIILRREITPAGKSRGFINDTPVNLALMGEIASRLINIHSQHSNSSLNDQHEQTSLIDIYGGNEEILAGYKDSFRKYVNLRGKINKAKEDRARLKENREYIKFRLEQLDKLKPKEGELENLEKEYDLLNNSDRIKSELNEAFDMLDKGSNSALKMINGATGCLDSLDLGLLQNHDEENLGERLNSIKIELRDIADTISGYMEKIDSDPERLEEVRDRIESLYDAMKRFKVVDEKELVELHNKLKEESRLLDEDSDDIKEREKELKQLAVILKKNAEKLTETRKLSAEKFSSDLTERIRPLGLQNVRFEVDIEKGKLTGEGQDQITFLCSFNKNHGLRPLSAIASGGEISRVMLGLKSIMAEKMHLPTVIFDEIDTGVSGEIAHKMGKMMGDLAENMQVISITHLPQVAVAGKNHFKVFKREEDDKTVSHIVKIEGEERIQEIAGMLSGSEINEASLSNAKTLLNIKD